MKQILYIILLFLPIQAFCQLTQRQELSIDSLKRCINTASHDTIKINAYNTWDNLIYVSNPKLDFDLNQKIVVLAEHNLKKTSLSDAEEKSFNKVLSQALNSLGIISYNEGDNDKAITYYSRSLKIRGENGDKKGLAATLNNLGIVHQDQGDYAKAITDYTHSLKTNEEIGDKNGEANSLSNIGRIYYEQGDTAKAIDHQTRSLKIRETMDDKRGMAIAYNNLGTIFSDQGFNTKAMEYLNRGLKLSEEIGDKNKIALALANIGTIYKKEQNDQEAMNYFNRSLKMFEEIGNEKWRAAILNHIGDIYKKQNKIDKAIENYQKALNIAQKVGFLSSTADVYKSLFYIYKKTGNYKDALKMHEFYLAIHDSVFSKKNQKEIINQEIKYIYDKQKALDLKDYEKKMAVASERNKKQKVIIYSITGSLTLVVIFSVFVYNRFKIISKQKKIIESQNIQIIESINYSKKIQDSLLPSLESIKKVIPGLFIFYEPKDIVSGDFYFFKEFEHYTLLACVDCTGHGVPGGFMSTLGCLLLDKVANDESISPSNILANLSTEIIRVLHQQDGGEIQDGMDLSICLIDRKNLKIEFSGARNGIIVVTDEHAKRYKADSIPVGGNYLKKGLPIQRNFKTQSISIDPSDWIYMYTDGFMEQIGGMQGVPMNHKQFENHLINLSKKINPKEKCEFLQTTFANWKKNNKRDDDILIMGFRLS